MNDSSTTPPDNALPSSDSSEKEAAGFAYKGPVSGLKGLITHRLASGLASVVTNTLDRVAEIGQRRVEATGTEALPIEKIYPCPDQPRQVFEPRSLEELSQTMKELGQAQAITVRKTAQGYEIISGERRYRAAKLAGLTELDCVVKDCTPAEGRLLALVENIQRQDLLPIEEAHFLKRVLEENDGMSLEKLAKLLGSHKSTLSEKIQLTEVSGDLQPLLYSKGRHFTHRHWRVISRIEDESVLKNTFLQAIEHQLSVAELERSLSALGVKKASRRRQILDTEQVEAAGAPERLQWVKRDGSTYRMKALTFDTNRLAAPAREQLIGELEQLLAELKASPVV